MHSKTWVYIPVRECDRTIFILVPQRQKKYILNSFKHFFFQNFRSLREYTLDHVQHTHNFSINHFASCLHRICQLWNKKITLFFLVSGQNQLVVFTLNSQKFFLEVTIFFHSWKNNNIIKKVSGSSFQYCNVTYWQFKYSLGQ